METALADYRFLYKTYLMDPDLQAARARFPFIHTWDDHEFTNDCWQSHDTYFGDGSPAQVRKLAANQSWFEYIPAMLSDAVSFSGVGPAAHDFRSATVQNTPMGAPDVGSMIVVSLVALAANVATLLILRRTKRGEAHIEASWIFTSNDIKVNALVILAGLLVWWSSSQVPDLIAGGLIFLIVANGARRILALSKGSSGR